MWKVPAGSAAAVTLKAATSSPERRREGVLAAVGRLAVDGVFGLEHRELFTADVVDQDSRAVGQHEAPLDQPHTPIEAAHALTWRDAGHPSDTAQT
ncbi:hypothetical protein GCM10017557_73110 [Streptomyces aurantiacus]|uniref:Uncharacterized protein n=1 Tax=Streptomyces aurantiacus TaxID=47760 RepID=A0A7G1PBN5_9ACTN|nr:hypothetical protein GCM10017557_73110 [Streptomyces aurantiacus]